jgi:hypothetical protein
VLLDRKNRLGLPFLALSLQLLTMAENKKGEGRFSFTFLRPEISPATNLADNLLY